MGIRIVCISDTHTIHGELVMPIGDILVHAGDLTDVGMEEDVADFDRWLGGHSNRDADQSLAGGKDANPAVRTRNGDLDQTIPTTPARRMAARIDILPYMPYG